MTIFITRYNYLYHIYFNGMRAYMLPCILKKLCYDLGMAIYHLSCKIISRNKGRSSVAAAAYRAAEKLLDERTGVIHDMSKKGADVVYSAILAPVDTPGHLLQREQLWNAVEAGERRKDAQVAREFDISLPRELTEQQNIELAKLFVQKEFVDCGMIADLCMHRGHQSREEQPHIHVMLTMRTVSKDGFGLKNCDWNDRELLKHWRKSWSEYCNTALSRHGHDMKIDHRTLEAQGIALEPQTKIGPKDAEHRMLRLEEHRQIARANGERILRNPKLVLDIISRQQSTFTNKDLERIVTRHTNGQEQFTMVHSLVAECNFFKRLGENAEGIQLFAAVEK